MRALLRCEPPGHGIGLTPLWRALVVRNHKGARACDVVGHAHGPGKARKGGRAAAVPVRTLYRYTQDTAAGMTGLH